jgi:serine/threonine protein kinase/dipeptidyl aminopeptidase/acylaminoacyl peptidase
VAELSPGATLAHYRIISKIGAGGMGEVYRAQDTELGRPVALKFLPSEVAAHQSRVKRFIQEAKAASALNHPNILTVYQIGRVDDSTYIATEFVDGITLRDHMRQQRLRLTEVLDIGIQIASALVAAHAAGIVHRDIKPENVMVRKDGIVKVLDFGLAKLTDRSDSSTGSEATTVALSHTEPGSILGTAAYMSPEQAAGREVDSRSDIWSLGVVLYELVASRMPFEGASKSHIIVAITDREPPPITQFVPDVPEALELIISEALTKDLEERCPTAKQMLGKLKRLKQRYESGAVLTSSISASTAPQSSHASVGPISASTPQQTMNETARSTAPSGAGSVTREVSKTSEFSKFHYAGVLALGLIVAAAAGFGLYKLFTQPKQFGPVKMTALTTGGKLNGEDINGQVSISPDGKWVVCGANDAKQQASLWIRQISTSSLVRIVPPETGAYLGTTFSPDGELVYFVAALERDNFVPTLYRIPVVGGAPPAKVLDRVFSAIGFSRDGSQFAFVRRNQDDTSLMVANTDGSGAPKSIAVLKQPNAFSSSGPSWSPDGKRIACGLFNGTAAGYSTVVEVPVEGGEPRPMGLQKWATVGRVIWVADGSGLIMSAQPEFSSIGKQIWFLPYPSGDARRITNDLNGYGDTSLGVTADSATIATIQQVTASGIWITAPNQEEAQAQEILKTNLPDLVAWTPDGKVAYSIRTGENWDIWVANRDGSESKQLTTDPFVDQQPTPCSDGQYIAFQSNRSRSWNIWRMNADGSNQKQLTHGDYVDAFPVCSADGRAVVFTSGRSGTWAIWKVGIDGGEPVQLTRHASEFPSISPDGKLIAYAYRDDQANRQPKLGIMPFEGGEPIKTIELPRTAQPIALQWMPDGRSIAYLDAGSGILNIWARPIDGGAAKQLTNFKSEFLNSFAISRDGKIAVYRFNATRDIVLIKDFR